MSVCAVGLLHGLVWPLAVYSFTEAAAIIPAEMCWVAVLQTAHEPSYLVKHLLGSLPPVVDRVKLMRKGQAPNGSSEDNLVKMAQSQVRLSAAITA